MHHMTYGDVSWERMERAVEKVRGRLLKAAAALERAGVPYAIVGGNAVAAWVSRLSLKSVCSTQPGLSDFHPNWPTGCKS